MSGETPTGTTTPSGAPSLPAPSAPSLAGTPGLSPVASQLPAIADQVPTALSHVATTVNNAASDIGQDLGSVPPLPTPPLSNPSSTVTKGVTGATNGLGIGG